ncbi:hypothetical protein M0805_008407 [Coniferiporia weirii]|nr:hypothetical protein M0805_008407 [Coniferiporia weirii]
MSINNYFRLGVSDEEERHEMPSRTPSSGINSTDSEILEFSYDRGLVTRKLTFAGLATSFFFGAGCISTGVLLRSQSLLIKPGTYIDGNLHFNFSFPYIREMLLLLLNVTFIKVALWSSGSAHELALKWKLAFEDDKQSKTMRLEFNTNLRFLQSSYSWWSANGLASNVIMALCLAASYASSSMVLLAAANDGHYNTVVSFVAIITLGVVTLLQVLISVWAVLSTEIPTYNTTPFDTAAALVSAKRLKRVPGRCMHSLYDKYHVGPINPREQQMSIWDSSPQFRAIVMCIWALLATGYFWLFIVWAMIKSGMDGALPGSSWAIIPGEDTESINFSWDGEVPTAGFLWGLGILIGFQGGIVTVALTCTQALAAMIFDEELWREAATENGSDPKPGPFKGLSISWQIAAIHFADPVLHWLFGLAVSVDAKSGVRICPVQILYVSILGTVGVVAVTVSGRHMPYTRQPSTYGHLQTLVNLVDEWHRKMYWGHKEVSCTGIGHAGTSREPLHSVYTKLPYGCIHTDEC